ncbi:hypothetical protein BGZ54_006524 [Gamsiella multidivaricata]|nr:hypothetical protein BGZ54_006524 [Gamsiella multidivaricata]
MSSPRSVLSSFFRSKDASVPLDVSSSTVANPGPKTGECAGATLLDVSVHPTHPVYPVDKPIHYRSSIVPHGSSDEDRVDDLSSPMGTSVDSTNNETFDGDEMDLQRSLNDASDSDSPMTAAGTAKYPLSAQAALRPENGSLFKLERKSRLRRQVNRLRTKNAALKSTVAQVKSDLALERQRRSTMDQIYLNIKKELNQKLETEEIKVLNLKGELEQMTAEMQELKDQLASARASSSKNSNGSSAGYKIGYDSSAFSLSGGFSELGGLILHHHANVNLVDSQDDSEEFLASHSYAASTRQTDSTLLATSGSGAMALNENEEDENDEDDDLSGDDDDDDEIDSGVSFSLIRTPKTLTPTASCRSSVSSDNLHPALAEEESEQMEDYTEQSDDDDSDKEYEDAPCTMMEIILQRQQSRSSEDEMNDPPADATETFESMAQKAMLQATQSKFTVAQTQLQLEELVLKFDARPEQTADVIAKEVSRWWEAERVATGGPFAGGWGHETVIISKETGERVSPKVAVERQVESFFGPLLLQFVTTLSEQRVLLDKLGECARADPQSLKNHNAVLVALYKYDVVEAEAVLEWWHSLEEPQGVFGHGGNNLRSLNSKFVAWLEDEEDDSESADDEDDDENDDDSGSDSDSCCSDMEEDEDEVEEDDDDGVVDSILDLAFPEIKPSSTPPPSTLQTAVSESTQDRSSAEPKRRISFCNNNMYYNQDGYAGVEDVDPMEETKTEKKKYTQCISYIAWHGMMDIYEED